LSRRHEWRVSMSLPIKVFAARKGRMVVQTAHTLDISRHGACISGVPCLDSPGQSVTIQCGENKAKFRVSWVGLEGTPAAGQVGLEALEGEPYIWGVDLPIDGPDEYEKPLPLADRRQHDERRSSSRCESGGGVQCWKEGESACLYGKLANLSKGGCFIETKSPFPAGTIVRVQFVAASGVKVRVTGEVRNVRPDKGMGVIFKSLAEQDREKLEALLHSVVQKATGKGSSSLSSLMSRSDMLALRLEQWFRQNENLSREQYLKFLTARQD